MRFIFHAWLQFYGPKAALALLSFTLLLTISVRPAPLMLAGPSSYNLMHPHKARLPDLGASPATFVPNAGQTDPAVRFLTHGMGSTVFFTPGEAVLVLPAPALDVARLDMQESPKSIFRHEQIKGALKQPRTVLRISFAGANSTPDLIGVDSLPGRANYFIGADPRKWQTDLPTCRHTEQRCHPLLWGA